MKYKKIGKTLVLSMLILNISCQNVQQVNHREYIELRDRLISNYENNKKLFKALESNYKLKHIRYIEFLKDNKISIQYQVDDIQKLSKIDNKEFASSEVIKILSLEKDMKIDSFLQLKKNLELIDSHSLQLLNEYDPYKGRYNKQLEIEYKKWNGLGFYYKIFEYPFDSSDTTHYNQFLTQKNTGGILSENVIWYYRGQRF